MDLRERMQLGRHTTLVEEEYLEYLTQLGAGRYAYPIAEILGLCDEFKDHYTKPQWKELRNRVHHLLKLSVGVKGRGRDDLVSIFTSEREEELHSDYGEPPPSMRGGAKAEAREARGELKRGLRRS